LPECSYSVYELLQVVGFDTTPQKFFQFVPQIFYGTQIRGFRRPKRWIVLQIVRPDEIHSIQALVTRCAVCLENIITIHVMIFEEYAGNLICGAFEPTFNYLHKKLFEVKLPPPSLISQNFFL
jgi:hypothetical protein